MSTTAIARRIARDLNSEANFAGDLQLVYDEDGRRVGCFPGGNALVHLWSEWRPGYKVFTGGSGRRFTADFVSWWLGEDEDAAQMGRDA
jgi:hypothetical protein